MRAPSDAGGMRRTARRMRRGLNTVATWLNVGPYSRSLLVFSIVQYLDLYPQCSSHAKPVVLADRRRAQTDPAGRLEKCGLELSLKLGHLASS